ncbi:MAG TPA: type VI secretion system baseplate subunit TssE [Urbifossiella sp.]|nr:type VI secretion system baseplate subunit TssE [Urbifossiella sp.]
MSPRNPVRLLPSFLDRLFDPESMGGRVAGYDHRQMMNSVRADLEELLNARQTYQDLPEFYTEATRSILTFGLPDLSCVSANSDAERGDLARMVQSIIARFEPRLRKIRVSVAGENAKAGLALAFAIEAELNVDPAPEIGFETILELTTGRATVTPQGASG